MTPPAWAALMTARNPGVLGIYGFRNRKDYSHDGPSTVDSASVRELMICDLLLAQERPSIAVGVPPDPINDGEVLEVAAPCGGISASPDTSAPSASAGRTSEIIKNFLAERVSWGGPGLNPLRGYWPS